MSKKLYVENSSHPVSLIINCPLSIINYLNPHFTGLLLYLHTGSMAMCALVYL